MMCHWLAFSRLQYTDTSFRFRKAKMARRTEDVTFQVSVKESNTKRSYMIPVNIKWNVAQVKQEISRKSGLPPDQFQLVFAGLNLKDEMTLKNVGIHGTSTIHFVRAANVQMQPSTPTTPVLTDINLGAASPTSPDVKTKQKTHFFVYCKNPCGGMSPGKLRVRCFQCKDPSFVLVQGPCNWKDVLTPQHMRGRCYNVQCKSDIAEFYFKCANHHTLNEDTSVPLHMIRNNNVGVECITCATETEVVVVFDCDVGHSMCIACFVTYIKEALNHRNFKKHPEYGYTIQCPNNCDGSEVKEIHHFRIMGGKDYGRYQQFGAEECLRQMGGIFCPAPGCCSGLIPEPGQQRIQCAECKFVFCSQCQNQYHTGRCTATPEAQQAAQEENPNRFNQNVERARWIAATERYVREISKACPQCHVAIQKTEGCNHMTCLLCKFEFCWLCLIEWGNQCQGAHWFNF